MEYKVGDKGYFDLIFIKEVCWEAPSYSYYNSFDTVHLYIFEDEDGNEFTWKTRKAALFNQIGEDEYEELGPKSHVTLRGTIKDITVYHGKPQVVLSRVHVVGILDTGISQEEYQAERKAKQLNSLKPNDEIKTVTYREYKENYADCETVIDSFRRDENNKCFIDIIIKGE